MTEKRDTAISDEALAARAKEESLGAGVLIGAVQTAGARTGGQRIICPGPTPRTWCRKA